LISQGGFDFVLRGFALKGTYGHGREFQRLEEGKDNRIRLFLADAKSLISENFKNLLAALLFLEEAIIHLIILGFADQNMPGGGD